MPALIESTITVMTAGSPSAIPYTSQSPCPVSTMAQVPRDTFVTWRRRQLEIDVSNWGTASVAPMTTPAAPVTGLGTA